MAEYLANAVQTVTVGDPILFEASIPCNRGYVYHEDQTGIFILRGAVNNPSCCFARYQVTYNGNIAVPGTPAGVVGPIAVAVTVNGEPRLTSRAIVTPAAVDEYNNVTSTAIITVPKGCCFSVSVRAVAATPTATTTSIDVQNSNLVINRIA
ncbi:MAG: hypothetical protein E7423_02920 [Ruminococcaceae bacterium]|nr:hypothetical protein [Oscillospiraceae bacterium]